LAGKKDSCRHPPTSEDRGFKKEKKLLRKSPSARTVHLRRGGGGERLIQKPPSSRTAKSKSRGRSLSFLEKKVTQDPGGCDCGPNGLAEPRLGGGGDLILEKGHKS